MAAIKPTPLDIEFVRACLVLDRETGRLIWLPRPREHFEGLSQWKRFNRCVAGTFADESTYACNGYRRVRIRKDGERICVSGHKIVFALVHGRWPVLEVDHIDGCRTNNRPANLREVTHQENMRAMTDRRRGETNPRRATKPRRSSPGVGLSAVLPGASALGSFCAHD